MSQFAPGSWPVSYAGADCSIFTDDPGAPDQASFEAMAAEMLWNWTGRVFSTYEADVRPCRLEKPLLSPPSSFEGSGPWPINPGFGSTHSTIGFNAGSWMPVLVSGEWFNIRCGSCGNDSCACEPSKMKSIRLPGPVASVDQVMIDGVPLDSTAYRLDYKTLLIRTDGDVWPTTQDLDLDDTQVGTWSVTYTKGIPVPIGGQVACGTLACELAKASVGSADCALPQRLQTVSREGVTVGVLDPFSVTKGMSRSSVQIPKIETGIWSIDAWTTAVTYPRAYSSVRSVDTAGTTRWQY